MTTVTAGQSATVTIPTGTAWSVTTSGEAQVHLVSGRSGAGFQSWRVTPDKPLALAPFNDGGAIRIVGVSGTTTDAARASETLTPAQVAATQALVSGASICAAASADTTGATDAAAMNATLADALARTGGRVRILPGTYILDRAITLSSGHHIEFDQGVVLKMADSVTKVCTLTSGSAVVQVPDTLRLRVGMLVLDTAANLQANNPFGATPRLATIQSIDSPTQITLNGNASASGSFTLRFYINDNVITVPQGVSGWSLVCRHGWAYLDGNRAHTYPYALDSLDSTGNGLRMVSPTDFTIDGICGRNARFHGAVGVGSADDGRVLRWRGENNGFRGWHMHGEAIAGNSTPAMSDVQYGHIEVEGNGSLAWLTTRGGDESNSGFFAVFDNVRTTQVATIRAKNEYGIGVHIAGGIGGFDPGALSAHNTFSSVVAENCGTGIFITAGAKSTKFPAVQIIGSPIFIASGCATLAAASITRYFQPALGGTITALIKAVQLPAGSIATYGIRGGHRCVMSGGSTGMGSAGTLVLFVEPGAGAGGTDLAWVMNSNPALDPYSTAATGLYAYFYTARDYGIYQSEAAGKSQSGVKFGDVSMVCPGQFGWASNLSSSEHRYKDVSVGSLSIEGAFVALSVSSMAGLRIGKLHLENNGTPVRHASNVSGSYNGILQNCADFDIGCFTSAHTLAATNNNESLRLDADCRNGTIEPIGVRKPASGYTINVLTTSGAGANAAGKSGPITLINPTASDGTPLTVAGGHINRTAASACIVTRPVDAA